MVLPAARTSVAGDFTVGRVILRGSPVVFRQSAGGYFVTESELSGKPWEHRVEYTLGGRRIQHVLTTLPDGSIVVLPPTWDIAKKKWVHALDADNPEEAGGVQIWNKACYSCHASGVRKNFDVEALRYQTTWKELGVSCEQCHGPGEAHAAQPDTKGGIVNPARLDALRSTMVCAQCHSLRDIYADGFTAGANSYDYFLPVMEYRMTGGENAAFWADGKPRWLANDATAFWQSQCFLKGGATCATCHTPSHNPNIDGSARLQADTNAACAKCHAAIGAKVTAHSHHAAKSAGSSCVECHMPRTVVSLGTAMRDHSIGVPVPANTVRYGIPNACNQCHKDKDAVRQSAEWYGAHSGEKLVRRAEAFTQARKGDASAITELQRILANRADGPWIRANAAGYLGNFPDDPTAYAALLHAFSDAEPLVRATAAAAIRPLAAQRAALAPQLVVLLRDPARTVRMNAAIAMVAMGVKPFAGEDGARFEEAKELYRARAALNADDAGQQFAAGRFFSLAGDMDGAVAAFRATLKLDPGIPAQYYLARSLAENGDFAAAREILKGIAREDPQYSAAERLLAEIQAKEIGSKVAGDAGAQALFLQGQVQYQDHYYGAALKAFEEALERAPRAEWAGKAQSYRAICLEKLGRREEAESAFAALLEKPEAPLDVDLQLAWVELLDQTGRLPEARQRIDALIAVAPNAPMAFFWRARVLLQLHHVPEAAQAAEEAIRLMPQLAEAHNLLIRIYQMQGRTREAAQQAEWLRDYQRRTGSH